jgi:hypothetical protein
METSKKNEPRKKLKGAKKRFQKNQVTARGEGDG